MVSEIHRIVLSLFQLLQQGKAKSKKEQNELNYRYRNRWKSDINQLKLTAIEAMLRWTMKFTEQIIALQLLRQQSKEQNELN